MLDNAGNLRAVTEKITAFAARTAEIALAHAAIDVAELIKINTMNADSVRTLGTITTKFKIR